jgi:hypothetical protein
LIFIQAEYKDKAISKKSIFHTIGKTQFGGVKEGLIELYHSLFVLLEVKTLPIVATE